MTVIAEKLAKINPADSPPARISTKILSAGLDITASSDFGDPGKRAVDKVNELVYTDGRDGRDDCSSSACPARTVPAVLSTGGAASGVDVSIYGISVGDTKKNNDDIDDQDVQIQ
ncbi:hypothetical protein CYMTET_51999 [Cymbomonas tetramitiformis]|uniref:Uncharacterized protein n=1 Tax=Cymbomonas tetramitiformis TaxID=36881 RepID=A0AAE0BLQ0_9CHLO|nr:hypothetical protein CYMTET_51999 [Cymbomonas tetramitiformis]